MRLWSGILFWASTMGMAVMMAYETMAVLLVPLLDMVRAEISHSVGPGSVMRSLTRCRRTVPYRTVPYRTVPWLGLAWLGYVRTYQPSSHGE
jgi:hypothetical protein